MSERYSAAVLRNRGVPVVLGLTRAQHEVVDGKQRTTWQLERGPDDAPLTESVWLRFDVNVMADIEDAFGSSGQWLARFNPPTEPVMEDGKPVLDEKGEPKMRDVLGDYKPTAAIRKTFALALGREERDVGVALLPEHSDEYARAIGIAWGLANGLDPQKAAEKLAEPIEELRAKLLAADAAPTATD